MTTGGAQQSVKWEDMMVKDEIPEDIKTPILIPSYIRYESLFGRYVAYSARIRLENYL